MYRSLDELSAKDKEQLVQVIMQKKSGLIDKDWSEICDDFDLDMSAETIRKAGVGIKLAADAKMLGGEK